MSPRAGFGRKCLIFAKYYPCGTIGLDPIATGDTLPMAKIYIDENNIVRVDTTRDGSAAREAGINRDLLRMANLLEELAHLSISAARRRGRGIAGHVEAIDELGRIKAEIRAEAIASY
jgi:hypothetical protein